MMTRFNDDCRKCSARKRVSVWVWRLRKGVRLLAVNGQKPPRRLLASYTDTSTSI